MLVSKFTFILYMPIDNKLQTGLISQFNTILEFSVLKDLPTLTHEDELSKNYAELIQNNKNKKLTKTKIILNTNMFF